MDQLNKLKIFIVDDEILYLNIFEQYIRNFGYNDVRTFVDGNKCVNNLSDNPDVVFLDYNMEPFTGYEVLKKIKRFNPNIYVVMISGQNEIKPAIDTLKYGAFDYIQKGENEVQKIKDVLTRIHSLNDDIERSKPSILKTLFQFL